MKLVRDRIPDIIREDGLRPIIHAASDLEYKQALAEKLVEEAREFQKSGALDELADLIEVVLAILHQNGQDWNKLEVIRKAKLEKRGGFTQKIIWEKNVRRKSLKPPAC